MSAVSLTNDDGYQLKPASITHLITSGIDRVNTPAVQFILSKQLSIETIACLRDLNIIPHDAPTGRCQYQAILNRTLNLCPGSGW